MRVVEVLLYGFILGAEYCRSTELFTVDARHNSLPVQHVPPVWLDPPASKGSLSNTNMTYLGEAEKRDLVDILLGFLDVDISRRWDVLYGPEAGSGLHRRQARTSLR